MPVRGLCSGILLAGRLRLRLYHFFFDLALLLVEDFGLAAGLAFLPDLHPHVLHILASFRKEPQLSVTASQHKTLVPWLLIVDYDRQKSTDGTAIVIREDRP